MQSKYVSWKEVLFFGPENQIRYYVFGSQGIRPILPEGWRYRKVDPDFIQWCADRNVTLTPRRWLANRPLSPIPANRPKLYDVVPNDENAAFEFRMRWR